MIGAHSAVVDSEDDIDERFERTRKVRIRDLVPGAAALGCRDDDAAASQAGEVVRHVRPGQLELLRKASRIGRSSEQAEQYA